MIIIIYISILLLIFLILYFLISILYKIHYSYQLENGCEECGIYVIDALNNKDTFVENKISPKFITIKIHDISQIEQIDKDMVDRNFVNVLIDKKLSENNSIKTDFLLSKYNFKKIEFFDADKIVEEEFEETELSIEDMLRHKVKDMNDVILLEEFENVIKLYKERFK